MAIFTADAQTIRPAELDEVLDVAEAEEEVVAVPTPGVKEPPTTAAEDLSLEQLQYLLEQKRTAIAQQAEAEHAPVKPPQRAPAGMLWIFNRGPHRFIWQYDAIVYEIEGHDMMLFPERVGRHGRKRSLISLDPILNTAVFQVVLEDDKKFGVPLRIVNRLELIDRTTDPNPLGRGAPVPTHPMALSVAGAYEAMQRRTDRFVELE